MIAPEVPNVHEKTSPLFGKMRFSDEKWRMFWRIAVNFAIHAYLSGRANHPVLNETQPLVITT